MSRFWSARPPRERALIIVCVVAVLVGVPMMLTAPGGARRAKLPADQADREARRARVQLATLQQETSRLEPEVARLSYDRPPEALIPAVVREMQAHAKRAGIHLREIKPLRARRFGSVSRVPLSVRFTSDFSRCVPFLYNIEDPAGRLVVEKFNVTASDPKSRSVDVEVQVALYTRVTGAAPDGI